jgi:DNA-binding NarL/FixJ family response regulator
MQQHTIKIILAEDHNIVREGIKQLLSEEKNISVVAEAVNGKEALNLIKNGVEADILLADINMPEMDGITLITELKNINSKIKVILLSMLDNEKYVFSSFNKGASGYLLKSVEASEMLFAIRHVNDGNTYICSEITEKLLNAASLVVNNSEKPSIELSIREIEVLHLIAQGCTNTEMADKLFVSKRTVEGYRQNILDKTGSKNTAALIFYAFRNGFLK